MKTSRIYLALIVCAWLNTLTIQNTFAKSVYAVAAHNGTAIKAYLVDPNSAITFQTDVEAANFVSGATGLCVWPSIDRMFITYEGSSKIAWASTKTMQRENDDEIDAPESNLAGVVADETNGVLYVVTRTGGRLYTYNFDEIQDTLVLVYPNDPAYPNRAYRQLEELDSGYTFGLALDEDGGPLFMGSIPTGRLYVANGTTTVRYYNTMTWELEGSVEMMRSAVGIDVDGTGTLYAGGYMGQYSHNFLLRYDLGGDPNTAADEKDMGYNITDVIIDRDTGILYSTTRQIVNGRTGAVEVYDPAGWDSADPNDFYLDTESDDDFNGPAGIGIGSQYKPGNGTFIEKHDDVTGCVEPNDVYHYDIIYHAGPEDEPNVVITDELPEGVDFVSADPNTGYYTERPVHTYTWELGDVDGWDPNVPGDPNYYFELTVQVNHHAEPAGILPEF